MTTLIRIKRSKNSGSVPTLVDGELAFNQVDKKLFTRDSTGTIKYIDFTSDAEKVSSGPIGIALSGKVSAKDSNLTGSTVAQNIKLANNGDSMLAIEDTTAPNTSFRLKSILSTKNSNSGNDWLFRQIRPSDGTYEDFVLRNGSGGDIWTSGNQKSNVFNQALTGGFSADDSISARIHRFGDRVFIGGAVVNKGMGNTRDPNTKDYFENVIPGTTDGAQLAVNATRGNCGVIGQSATIFSPPIEGNMGTWGLGAIAINNRPDNINMSYEGIYVETRNYSAHGYGMGVEMNFISSGPSTKITPYSGVTVGQTKCYTASAGREDLPNMKGTVSIGYEVGYNTDYLLTGLSFNKDAIHPSGHAIEMATGHDIAWYSQGSPNTPISQIRSDCTGSIGQKIIFSDNGLFIQNQDASTTFMKLDVANGMSVYFPGVGFRQVTLGPVTNGFRALQIAA